MGACARAQPGSTSTELKVRIGPVARETEGFIRMWPGAGVEIFTETVELQDTRLDFTEAAIFRNTAVETSPDVKFKLTKASPNTFAGSFEKSGQGRVQLDGHERGSVMRVGIPHDFAVDKHSTVDVCIVLKEPTIALDFTARISAQTNKRDNEECLRAIAKSINVNAQLVGEKIVAAARRSPQTKELELFVTKPYLSEGMLVLNFQ
jgi:hypothetical protein